MSYTAKILEMATLGFSRDQIAKHLNVPAEEVGKLIRQNARPRCKTSRTSRQPKQRVSHEVSPKPANAQPTPIKEIRPGIYLLTADDLISFTQQVQQTPQEPVDPYEDYVPREAFQKQYSISDSSIDRYRKKGILRLYKLGSKQFVKKSQIVQMLESGELG